MLLQDLLSCLFYGAAVGSKQSPSVPVGIDGMCLFCECSHINQNVASAGAAHCGQHTLSSTPDTPAACGDGLFAHLLFWGLCDNSWRAAF